MRDILEVVDKMLAVTPQEDRFHTFLAEFREEVSSNCLYWAPEMFTEAWRTLVAVVNRSIPYPPKEDWHWKVAELLSAKTRAELENGMVKETDWTKS